MSEEQADIHGDRETDNEQDLQQDKQEDSQTNVIVNYLPQTMSQDDIRALFERMGELESCKLIRDKGTGMSLGYGFVNYKRIEDAQKAVSSLNGLRLQNKTIKVSLARPSSETIKGANLYVSGVPKNWTQKELDQLFAPYGCIVTSRILCDLQTGMSKGVGFVRFDKRTEAEGAIKALNGTIPAGSSDPVTVKFANSPTSGGGGGRGHREEGNNSGPPTPRKTPQIQLPVGGLTPAVVQAPYLGGQPGRKMVGPIHHPANRVSRYSPLESSLALQNGLITGGTLAAAASAGIPGGMSPPGGWCLFVYNLPPELEESALWQLFGPFGAVQSVKVVREMGTQKCKGFGFVTMTNYDEAVLAISSLNGHPIGNRALQVSFKKTKGMGMPMPPAPGPAPGPAAHFPQHALAPQALAAQVLTSHALPQHALPQQALTTNALTQQTLAQQALAQQALAQQALAAQAFAPQTIFPAHLIPTSALR